MPPRTITIEGVVLPLRFIWYELAPADPVPRPDELLASVIAKGTRVGSVYHIITCRRIKSSRYCRYQLGVVPAPDLRAVASIRTDGVYVRDVKAHPIFWLPRPRRR